MKGKLNILKTGILLLTLVLSASAASALLDLQVSGISVKHNTYTGAWANLSNTVNVTVLNNGAEGAGSFNVTLYADSVLVDKKSVSGLATGANNIVSFSWKPAAVNTYTLRAEADPENVVAESNETNNNFTISQQVLNNGYTGDKPLTTYAHGTVKGDIFFTYGNSSYSGLVQPSSTFAVQHTVTLPAGSSVKLARLYNYWTWSYQGSTGLYPPSMGVTFKGNTVSPDATYNDRKGWGSYDYPSGTWGYNVTSLVTGNGTYTTVVTNNGPGIFALDGLGLLIVYEDPNGKTSEYWINEGADMISTDSTSGGLTPEEATTESLFSGSVDTSNVNSVRLWTVVQSGANTGDMLLFNDMNWSGVYPGNPYSALDIDQARSVKDNLKASDNIAQIRAAPSPGDYLMPSNAFLVVNYNNLIPTLSISANPTAVTVSTATDVTFTVTSTGTAVSGASVTLSGNATGSGTTDANGSVKLSVNATGAGTITATTGKTGYTSATTSLTANAGGTPSLSISANPTAVTVSTATDVTFTVTSTGTAVSGVSVALSGNATGSGTTDANGSVKISVNATGAGTITATASKTGYIGATAILTASEKHTGVSSSVSLGVDIMPAISLVVTPDAIDFGELSPGETSGVHTLTLNNTGGYTVSVTAEVNDIASNLFVNGLLLNSNAWSAYSNSIVSGGSNQAGATLKVPGDYAGVGAKEGTLVFWAQKS